MRTVGILGGGQLGMLLSESIFDLGGDAVIYDPDKTAPAVRRLGKSRCSPWTDTAALRELSSICDVITYEFENIECDVLSKLDPSKPVIPSVEILALTQNRATEKQFLKKNSLPHTRFAVAETHDQLQQAGNDFGYPFIWKTSRGGYDGKGQFFISTREDFENLLHSNDANRPAILEEVIEIELEASCIVARSPKGQQIVFPVFENHHKNHILDFTVLPARLPAKVAEALQKIAIKASDSMNAYGLLTVEFFLSKKHQKNSSGFECDGWYIYINEFAPRPHNSGHITRNACTVSQYDALACILLDMPLEKPKILADGYFCMVNLLGDVWLAQGNSSNLKLDSWAENENVLDVVIYGKKEAKPKRKMGHLVTHAATAEKAITEAISFRDSLSKSLVAE